MFKRIAVRASVLMTVFIVAVIVFSYLTNQGTTDMSADMGGATYPRICFTTEGYEVNSLPGYRTDMVLTSMRDTLTPVKNRQLEVNLDRYDTKVQKMSWQVFSLNGEECLQQETVNHPSQKETIKFEGNGILSEERVLKITLHLEGQDIYYYTRIKDSNACSYKTCLDFVQDFHKDAMNQENTDVLKSYLETNSSDMTNSYQTVTISSDIAHVTWGELNPEVLGKVQWEVKECNETYTSILLSYRVKCPGVVDHPDSVYTIKEFFRVRIMDDKQYLLDYNRTMDQVFDGAMQALDTKGILLGMAPTDLEYKTNSDETIVSFVQNDELWNYDKEAAELSLLFSFADAEGVDIRNLYDRHEIHIISVDEKGNTTFTVTGYMNRGIHEGQVGVAVYYFDGEDNSVMEKAFVPSTKGYYVMKEELGKYVYFSNKSEMLYVMMDGTLYSVDLEEDTREVLVRGLEEGQYKASNDGHLIAYQNMGGKLNESQKITVLNLQTGKSYEITSQGEEYLKPIGFIKDDFAYGTLRANDAGITAAGQAVHPMYKLEIVNQKQEIVKNYEVPNVYIQDGYIDENLLTLHRLTKKENVYSTVQADYITNNEEKKQNNITLETYYENQRETVVRLTYEDGIRDTHAKELKPKQVLFDRPMTISFDEAPMQGKYYVYAEGQLQGMYTKASYAVEHADETKGAAVSSRQAYVWERGNWPNVYEVDGFHEFSAAEGESSMAACLNQILQKEGSTANAVTELAQNKAPEDILTQYSGGEGLDLTGCSIEQILYTISQETPVIALVGIDHAVLVFGYTKTNLAYYDPQDGNTHSVTKEAMEGMVKACGSTFIGYVK